MNWHQQYLDLAKAALECASDLESYVEREYPKSDGDLPGRECYPEMQRRYERGMQPIRLVRKLAVPE